MPRKRTTDPKFIVQFQKQVAEFFKVHLSTVRFWFTDGCPHGHRHYDLRLITKWRLGKMDNGTPPDESKLKLQQIKLRTEELKLMDKERDHCPSHFAKVIVNDFMHAMDQVGDVLAAKYDQRARDTMDGCLLDMSRAVARACREWNVPMEGFGIESKA